MLDEPVLTSPSALGFGELRRVKTGGMMDVRRKAALSEQTRAQLGDIAGLRTP